MRRGRCLACNQFTDLDRAHIKSSATGGTWDDYNILLICRNCHTIMHAIGWWKMANKYPGVMAGLTQRGWYFEKVLGVIKLYRDQAH